MTTTTNFDDWLENNEPRHTRRTARSGAGTGGAGATRARTSPLSETEGCSSSGRSARCSARCYWPAIVQSRRSTLGSSSSRAIRIGHSGLRLVSASARQPQFVRPGSPLPTPRTTHAAGLRLLVWCTGCQHQVDADLEALIAAGRGDVPLRQLRFRCSRCGGRLTRPARGSPRVRHQPLEPRGGLLLGLGVDGLRNGLPAHQAHHRPARGRLPLRRLPLRRGLRANTIFPDVGMAGISASGRCWSIAGRRPSRPCSGLFVCRASRCHGLCALGAQLHEGGPHLPRGSPQLGSPFPNLMTIAHPTGNVAARAASSASRGTTTLADRPVRQAVPAMAVDSHRPTPSRSRGAATYSDLPQVRRINGPFAIIYPGDALVFLNPRFGIGF